MLGPNWRQQTIVGPAEGLIPQFKNKTIKSNSYNDEWRRRSPPDLHLIPSRIISYDLSYTLI